MLYFLAFVADGVTPFYSKILLAAPFRWDVVLLGLVPGCHGLLSFLLCLPFSGLELQSIKDLRDPTVDPCQY